MRERDKQKGGATEYATAPGPGPGPAHRIIKVQVHTSSVGTSTGVHT